MFRNKLLVRASLPSSSPFFLVELSLTLPPPPSLSTTDLETLCCNLSRNRHLACFPHSSSILLIYQGSQSDSAAQAVGELAETLPISNVTEEEEVREASLIARAVECGLRSVMLDGNWRCVGESLFVDSSMGCGEERTPLHAVNVVMYPTFVIDLELVAIFELYNSELLIGIC